jgi:hypothetical protein
MQNILDKNKMNTENWRDSGPFEDYTKETLIPGNNIILQI